MSANLRLPNIPPGTPQEQMKHMQSYMYQLVEQLQWALDNIDKQASATTSATTVVQVGSSSKPTPSSSSIDAEATFEAIKSLIIKSADIVGAYYEEINRRLEGEYVAVSDFGTYSEQTAQDIVTNSTNININLTNLQEVKTGVDSSLGDLVGEVGQVGTKVGEVDDRLSGELGSLMDEVEATSSYIRDIKAAIKIGLLYDGVYGIEVGQKTTEDGEEVFNKFARFTADKLSFYDNNAVEVAYISDYRLYISDVEITSNYKIGGYIDTVMADGRVVTKWVGRS